MELLAYLLLVAAAWVVLRELFRKRSPNRRSPRRQRRTGTLTGKAYVTDGDGIRVSGQEVRFAGVDAPEWDQRAKHQDGYWFATWKACKERLDPRDRWQASSRYGQGL